MSWKDKDYDVGFGKPPKSGQFVKGKSGNSNGRPKGTRNFNTDLEEVLAGKVTVIENGKPKKVSSQLAAMMRLREKALGGNPRAMDRYLALAQQLNADKEVSGSERLLIAAEEDILHRYVEDMRKPASNEGSDEEEPEDG
jgi:hypothetical protein